MHRTALLACLTLLPAVAVRAADAPAVALASAPVRSGGVASVHVAEGVVEAVRQTAVAAQVSGAIVALGVRAGDAVASGQTLARIDPSAANQAVAASNAQVAAARAELEVAKRDYARQKQLFDQRYISQAALDRADAQFKTAQAQADALLAQASATRTQSGYYTLTAPYAGLVAELPVSPGDMAMPGRALMTLYDPSALRVTVNVPQTVVAELAPNQPVRIEFPGLPAATRWQVAARVTVLPMADAATHTVQIRLDLKGKTAGLAPGMFARALLPLGAGAGDRLYVPVAATFRRAELTAVYVLGAEGRPLLRQVKLGAVLGQEVEVLAGVAAGERIALEPLAAARVR